MMMSATRAILAFCARSRVAAATVVTARRPFASLDKDDDKNAKPAAREMRGGGSEQVLSPEQEAERRELDAQGIPLDKRPGARAEDFVPPLDISDEAKRAQPPRCIVAACCVRWKLGACVRAEGTQLTQLTRASRHDLVRTPA